MNLKTCRPLCVFVCPVKEHAPQHQLLPGLRGQRRPEGGEGGEDFLLIFYLYHRVDQLITWRLKCFSGFSCVSLCLSRIWRNLLTEHGGTMTADCEWCIKTTVYSYHITRFREIAGDVFVHGNFFVMLSKTWTWSCPAFQETWGTLIEIQLTQTRQWCGARKEENERVGGLEIFLTLSIEHFSILALNVSYFSASVLLLWLVPVVWPVIVDH